MDVLTAIRTRRSVRSYEARAVPDESIQMLLEAGVQGPSAMNAQPWIFSVVQDPARLARWSALAKTMLLERVHEDPKARGYASLLADESFSIFYDASTLIVISAAERGPYVEAACWLAAQSVMLAATEAKLGTCCIGFAVGVLNTAEVKRELGLPDAGIAICPIIVGYPRVTLPAPTRPTPRIGAWLR